MHAISAVQYYALRCNALHCLPTTMKQFVSHRITHIHTCAQKRRAERSVNALDKDPPPPHSLLPAPKPNQPLPYPSQTGKQEKKDERTTCDPAAYPASLPQQAIRRVTLKPTPQSHSTCPARVVTQHPAPALHLSLPPNAHPLHQKPPSHRTLWLSANLVHAQRTPMPPHGTAAATRVVGRLLSVRPRCQRVFASRRFDV